MTAVDYLRGNDADLTHPQVADRIAIRELVDAYARCADRREAAHQMALFTEDTEYEVYDDIRHPSPTQNFPGREALAPVFEGLKNYDVTMHFNGQSTIVLDGDTASGETYCLCHMIKADKSTRDMLILSLRYLDSFVRSDGVWLVSKRTAMVDWTETRSLP